MEFQNFRRLIEERKRLKHGVDKDKNFSRIQQIDKILIYEAWKKHKDIDQKKLYLELMQDKINLLFEIGYVNVARILKKYFKEETHINYTLYSYREKNPRYMELVTTKGTYDLGPCSQNNTLYCLCDDGRDCWRILLRDYPDLIDFLWDEFRLLKNAKKTEHISLIQKMIKEKCEEKELLESPELREDRIFQINKDLRELDKILLILNNSSEEFEV